MTRTQPPPSAWALHLMAPAEGPSGSSQGCAAPAWLPPTLSPAEAQRVQRHRDDILRALQTNDRSALRAAKQRVLEAAFRPTAAAAAGATAPQQTSPALRGALRDLAWRMAVLLLPRGAEQQR